jgi:hypothetical protein
MTHEIDIGGQQGRGNPSVGHDLDDAGYLVERERGHWRAAVFWGLVAWALVIVAAVSACELAELIQH